MLGPEHDSLLLFLEVFRKFGVLQVTEVHQVREVDCFFCDLSGRKINFYKLEKLWSVHVATDREARYRTSYFFARCVTRNREAIEAKQKHILSTSPTLNPNIYC